MTRTTRSRDPYGPRAARSYRSLIDPLLVTFRPRIVSVCRELGVRTLLDIACATGAQCRALGRAGIETTGLDLSEAMIAAARRLDGRNVRYVQGSAYELPFAAGTFDAAILSLALHEHTEPERQTMVAEASRVIRQGGSLIVADYARPRWSVVHVPWQLIRLVEWIAGPEHNAGFRDYANRGSLRGLIDRSGLQASEIRQSHVGAIEIAVCPVRDRS